MQNANYQNESDFNDALKSWDVPAVPTSLDQRVFASFQQQTQRVSFWQRFFTASIRIPVPLVAAAALLLLLVSGVLIAMNRATTAQVVATANPVIKEVTKTEIVEVPVVKERVVTRVVYVEKPRPAQSPQMLMAQTPNAYQSSEIKLASHVAGDNAYTNVDLSGYQPVEEMKVRIIKGSAANEH